MHEENVGPTQTENAPKESEERFRGFAEAAFEGISIAERGTIIEANQQLARMLGYEVDELIGMDLMACVAPTSRELVREHGSAGFDQPYEHLALRKDGTSFPVEVRGKTITYRGRPVRAAAIRDITARKQAEEALRKSEECFSKIFYASPVAIALSGIDDGHIIDVNDRFLDLFGFSRDEVLGRSALELGVWKNTQMREQIVASLQQQEKARDFEIQFVTKSGARRDGRGAVEMIELGGRLCLLWMGVDDTERKHYEEALVAAKEQAEEMNHLKSAFLANMSHEFRTPLAGIIGFSEILATEAPEAQRPFARLIELSGRRLLDTLNAVLDLSMLESGGLKLNREGLNVAEEVQKKVGVWHLDAQAKGVHLELLLPAVEVEAMLDRACFDRILHHLVGNAIKFTERGEIIVAVLAVDDRVEIEVRDTGIGISPAFVPRLFEAFKQESTGRGRTYEGAGLGLTITRRLVELMGGEIRVVSQKGSGSIFTVSFPRCAATRQAGKKAHDREPCSPAGQSPVQGRVLAVDDNPAMLYLLERFLEEIPEVSAFDTAEDDETAHTLAQKHRYDVVLMDINLGGARTGEDVLHDLRSLPDYAATPVVAVTAYAMPEDRARFLEAGFDAYLGKPFTEEQLRTLLTQMLPTLADPGPLPPPTKIS